MRSEALAVTQQEEEQDLGPAIHLKGLEEFAIVEPESVAAVDATEQPGLQEVPAPVESRQAVQQGDPGNFVFGENFVVDTMDVPNAKIIPQVIRGVALDLFPDGDKYRSNDFYYAYSYNGTQLVFVIVKSKAYVAGELPGFLPAILTPGRYSYRHGSQHFVIEHTAEEGVTTKVYQEPQPDCIDLEAALEELGGVKLPPSLHLQWSLAHNYKPVTLTMLAVFLGLLGVYFMSLQGYKEIAAQSARVAQQAPPPPLLGLPPVGEYMKVVADTTAAKGAVIKQVKKIDKTNLAFAVEFQNENDTREFITRKGGRYEDGKVVFAFDLAGAGQPGTGR
ncbi:hypothetical protein [Geomonas subterranea]|uniref:hypothetical protein n=1 Tax=Geomonas subterranea TaxID=2847989 RepID=UPI001CD2486D|nr:hypothetical protein [Geomonas fuzhouensis]